MCCLSVLFVVPGLRDSARPRRQAPWRQARTSPTGTTPADTASWNSRSPELEKQKPKPSITGTTDRILLLNVTDPDTKAGGQMGHEHVMVRKSALPIIISGAFCTLSCSTRHCSCSQPPCSLWPARSVERPQAPSETFRCVERDKMCSGSCVGSTPSQPDPRRSAPPGRLLQPALASHEPSAHQGCAVPAFSFCAPLQSQSRSADPPPTGASVETRQSTSATGPIRRVYDPSGHAQAARPHRGCGSHGFRNSPNSPSLLRHVLVPLFPPHRGNTRASASTTASSSTGTTASATS